MESPRPYLLAGSRLLAAVRGRLCRCRTSCSALSRQARPAASGEVMLGPLNPPWNVGRVGLLLRGNDIPAKLGRFPNGNVTAPETPKIFLGNSVELDAVHESPEIIAMLFNDWSAETARIAAGIAQRERGAAGFSRP